MPDFRRPSYSVVSGLVLFLALFGFALKLLRGQIPPVRENALGDARSMFLRQAGNQRINWMPMGEEAVAVARTKAVPILLVIGTAWSRAGRELDRVAFSDNRIAEYLNDHFVCARVDFDEYPHWRSAFLPLSRARIGFLPDLQIAFLEPDGLLLQLVARVEASGVFDSQGFLNLLIQAKERHEKILEGDRSDTHEALQLQNVARLSQQTPGPMPNLRAFAAYLDAIAGPAGGFWPVRGTPSEAKFQRLYPLGWQFLALSGQTGLLDRSLRPALRSGMVDWLDGGFFHLAIDERWERIDFDKVAVEQANLGLVLAQTRAPRGSLVRTASQASFQSLVDEFMDGGLLRPSRRGDEAPNARSVRSSFSPRQIWDLGWSAKLDEDDLKILRGVFGLRVETNRPMVVKAEDPAKFLAPPGQAVLRQLREIAAERPRQFSDGWYLDVNATCAARMIEAARLWDDQKLLSEGLGLCDGLEAFRAADDVSHTQTGDDYAYLGDYLAYADARLQDYLASGRVPSLESGLAVLRRATVVFRDSQTGTFTLHGRGPLARPSAELVDGVGESATAQLMRLLDAYGRLLQADPAGIELRKVAFALAGQYEGAAAESGIAAAGYFCSALRMANELHAFAVGPDAIAEANRLHRLRPFHLVAPAFGPVRTDLQNRRPGIYLVDAGGVAGPFTISEAAKRLPKFLRL